MSKEIKFRQPVYENGKFIKWHYWGLKNGLYQFTINQHESQQYSTLKDKNGHEIFEGDIIDWTVDVAGVEETYRSVVKLGKYCTNDTEPENIENWHCGFYLCPIEIDMENWSLTDSSDKEYQFVVVGNIIENPEMVRDASLIEKEGISLIHLKPEFTKKRYGEE